LAIKSGQVSQVSHFFTLVCNQHTLNSHAHTDSVLITLLLRSTAIEERHAHKHLSQRDLRATLHAAYTPLRSTILFMRTQLWYLAALLSVCASFAAAQTCPASFFGSTASAYNVFLLGSSAPANYTFDLINGDVEGRVASNGNFRAVNFGVGTRLGICNASTPTLVIGGCGTHSSLRSFPFFTLTLLVGFSLSL
jgi:hypothetical protein